MLSNRYGMGLLFTGGENHFAGLVSDFHTPTENAVRGGSSVSIYPWPSLDPSAGTLPVFSRFHALTNFGTPQWSANVLPGVNSRSFVERFINDGSGDFAKVPTTLVNF